MENIPKIEGHAAFYTHLKNGHIDEAKIIGLENDRFVEKILFGRQYWEAPIITSRICGICPTIHSTTAIKAVEAACGIVPTDQTVKLRKLMLAAQMIQSHSLHLYLLVLPDYAGFSSSFELQKMHPDIFGQAITLKKYADSILEVVGGRAVHPIASVVGGFKSFPEKEELIKLLELSKTALETAEKTLRLFASFEYPQVLQKLIYSALHHDKEYAYYDGEIWTSKGDIFKPKDYAKYVYEELKPYTRAKFGSLKGHVMMVGAIARLNLNRVHGKLTKKLVAELGIKLPFDNPFQNIIAQAIENYFFVEKSIELLEGFLKNGIENEPLKIPKEFGIGTAACEAPRGTLFHYYELNGEGKIVKCDIITPTVQSLGALEADIGNLSPIIKNLKPAERIKKIEMLIRSYDPCITCATH